MSEQQQHDVIAAGRFLRLVRRNGWEFTERTNASGVVAIVAVTDDGKLIITEQFRPPIGKRVVDLPAGLAGDIDGQETEEMAEAAQRELVEEVGYEAAAMRYLFRGPSSPGLSSEIITFFRAEGLRKVGDGGGDDCEDIVVHEIPLDKAVAWMQDCEQRGLAIDPKIIVGLYFAGVLCDNNETT